MFDREQSRQRGFYYSVISPRFIGDQRLSAIGPSGVLMRQAASLRVIGSSFDNAQPMLARELMSQIGFV
jgi:hypothetical protein